MLAHFFLPDPNPNCLAYTEEEKLKAEMICRKSTRLKRFVSLDMFLGHCLPLVPPVRLVMNDP